jgi:hypothetical protein
MGVNRIVKRNKERSGELRRIKDGAGRTQWVDPDKAKKLMRKLAEKAMAAKKSIFG